MEISFLTILPFLLIGAAVGFLGGFLGVGGGVIMIPLLYYWAFPNLQIPPEIIVHLSFGTSLAIIVPTSLSSSLAHSRTGNVDWRIVFRLTGPGIPASFLGSTLAAHLEGSVLRTLFGLLLMVLAIQMLLQGEGGQDGTAGRRPGSGRILLTGFLVGMFSGFFGLGGGVIAIPLMVRVLQMPIHQAVGNSISFVFFASLVGTAGYMFNGWAKPSLPPFTLGYVHALAWLLAGLPSILSAQWGARLARRTKPVRLRRAFMILLAAVGLRMLL